MSNIRKNRRPVEDRNTYLEPLGSNKKPRKRKKKSSYYIKLLITIIIIVVVALVSYKYFVQKENAPLNKLNQNLSGEQSSVNMPEPMIQPETASEEVVSKSNNDSNSKEEDWDKNRIERDGEHRTKLSDKKIGAIIVDRVKINEPVYAGASELNLRRGSATVDFKEPLTEKTTAIAGHVAGRYEYFTEIKQLVDGDIIKVKDYKNKKTYTYKVKKHYTVKPTQRSVLNNTKNKKARKLILITCHNYDSSKKVFTERWIVEAFEI